MKKNKKSAQAEKDWVTYLKLYLELK